MARRAKAPVEGGTENFQVPARNAGRNGVQTSDFASGDDYPAGADKDRPGSYRSDKFNDGGLSDEEIGAMIQQELTDARVYIDLEVGPMRAAATQAYRGILDTAFEDAAELTSQSFLDQSISPATRNEITSRDVRDSILGLMPDLMRIFTSTQSVCEYKPENVESVEMAEQATDYANYVMMRDNCGFRILHDAFKDALKFKASIVKVWWDDSTIVRTEHYRNLNPDNVFILEQDPEVETIEVIKKIVVDENGQTINNGTDSMGTPIVDVRIKRRVKNGRIKLTPLPPEEFIIDRRARSLDKFTICGHRSMKTVGEMVALGFDEDTVREHVTSPEMDTNVEYIARQPWARVVGSFDGLNPAMQRVLVVEAYCWLDSDGDGVPELWQIWTLGPSYKIIHKEMVDYLPFADFHCDPEPHTFFGESISDVTMDIQRIKTQIWRDSLDSLAQSVRPRMAIVEGQVNYDDVLNNEIGSIIRMRQPGMVQPLDTPFVGQNAFPMIEYIDSVLEKRTGVSLQSMGLDADSLQSTTRLAVQQQVSASQGRVELLARVLAEGVRKVFDLILKLSCTHQDKPRIVQLRGKFVPIDPRYWNADMSVEIAVGLGDGTAEQKITVLMGIKQAQEQILMTLGPQNPLVGFPQYSYTLRKLAELAGFRDATKFFNELPANFQMPPPPQPAQQNPEMVKAQAQVQQMAAQHELDVQRLQLDQQKATAENARLVARDNAEMDLKRQELNMRAGLDAVKVGQDMKQSMYDATAAHQSDLVKHGATLHTQRAQNSENNASKERIAAIMARSRPTAAPSHSSKQ